MGLFSFARETEMNVWLGCMNTSQRKCSSCFCVGVKQHGSKSSREMYEFLNKVGVLNLITTFDCPH